MAEKRGGISADLKPGVTPPTDPPPRPADHGGPCPECGQSAGETHLGTCSKSAMRSGVLPPPIVGGEINAAKPEETMGGEEPMTTADPLVVFLYVLLRDHMQPGEIEGIMQHHMRYVDEGPREHSLCNGYIAGYAVNLAGRIKKFGPPYA